MTRIIDQIPPASCETEDISFSEKGVYTCHQLRSMIPVIGAIAGSVFIGSLWGAFIGYVTMGIICDWMIFNVFKAKDSERIPPHQLEKEEMTGEQYDRLNSFLIKVRRASFGISAGVTALHVFLVDAEDYKIVFFGTYALIALFSIFWGINSQRISYPHWEFSEMKESPPFACHRLGKELVDPTSNNIALNPFGCGTNRPSYYD